MLCVKIQKQPPLFTKQNIVQQRKSRFITGKHIPISHTNEVTIELEI